MGLEEMRAQLRDPNRFQSAMDQRLRQNNTAAQFHLAQHHHAHPDRYNRRQRPPSPPPPPSQIEHHQANVDNLRNQIRNANGLDEQLRRALDDLQRQQDEVQWVRNIYRPPEVDDDQGQDNPDPRHAAHVAMAARQAYVEPDLPHHLGAMDVICTNCKAKHYLAEKLFHSSQRNPKFGMCCLQGQVKLDPPQPPPAGLKQLWTSGNEVSKTFRKFPRRYNNAFAFTSLGVKDIYPSSKVAHML